MQDGWEVELHRNVDKFFRKLKRSDRRLFEKLSETFDLLVADLELNGPEVQGWKNFGILKNQTNSPKYHCHLDHNYIACWLVRDFDIQLIEVDHVSSREDSPY